MQALKMSRKNNATVACRETYNIYFTVREERRGMQNVIPLMLYKVYSGNICPHLILLYHNDKSESYMHVNIAFLGRFEA